MSTTATIKTALGIEKLSSIVKRRIVGDNIRLIASNGVIVECKLHDFNRLSLDSPCHIRYGTNQ